MTNHQNAIVSGKADGIIISLIATCLAFQFYFIFSTDINWDEFYFLSQVYDYQRGTLEMALQTIHVHFFTWLAHVSQNEVNQVIAGRLVMFCLYLPTLFFIYSISRQYTDETSALAAIAAFCMFSFSLENATSFRTDPLALFFMMAALWMSVKFQWLTVPYLMIGALVGLAGLTTIKSIFLAPVIGIVILVGIIQSDNRRKAMITGLASVASALFTFGLLYLWHKSTLAAGPAIEGSKMLSHSIAKTILESSLFPQGHRLFAAITKNVVISLLFDLRGGGLRARHGKMRPRAHKNHRNQA